MMDDEVDTKYDPGESYSSFDGYEMNMSTESMPRGGPKSVHQCDVCNKIFVSLKG